MILEKVTTKVSEEDFNRVYNLYKEKKSQLTLDGKGRVIISNLTTRFPIVSIAGTGDGVEFSFATVERILNTTCEFKS